MAEFLFNPNVHPRDRFGKFRSVLERMREGDRTRLPDGTRVERAGEGFLVVEPGKGPQGGPRMVAALHAHAAVRAALDASARSRHPESLGGTREYPGEAEATHRMAMVARGYSHEYLDASEAYREALIRHEAEHGDAPLPDDLPRPPTGPGHHPPVGSILGVRRDASSLPSPPEAPARGSAALRGVDRIPSPLVMQRDRVIASLARGAPPQTLTHDERMAQGPVGVGKPPAPESPPRSEADRLLGALRDNIAFNEGKPDRGDYDDGYWVTLTDAVHAIESGRVTTRRALMAWAKGRDNRNWNVSSYTTGQRAALKSLAAGHVNALAEAVFDELKHPRLRGRFAGKGGGRALQTRELHTRRGSGGRQVYTPERARLHKAIMEHFLAGKVAPPRGERVAHFMAGGTASGKSTIIGKGGAVKTPGHAVHIDPDAIKAMLPEYRHLVRSGDERAARLAHEESSDVAKHLLREAKRRGLNVLIDGTGDSEPGKFAAKLADAIESGYKTHVTYVNAPVGEAVKRADERAKKTGRKVDEKDVRSLHANVSARFREVEAMAHRLHGLELHDTFEDKGAKGSRRVLHVEDGRIVVDDQARYKAFLAKAHAA